MKKLPFLFCLLTLSFSLYAKNVAPAKASANGSSINSEVDNAVPLVESDIVINLAMIEKFNNAEFSSDQLSFSDLTRQYNFQEMKQISLAYSNGDIEILSEASINKYKKESLNNDKWLHLYSESELTISTE